jgi:endoglucanase
MFGRPFDANSVYTYHKFWANPTRDSLQSYLDFSNRWNVPLLIGETGEANNTWNEKFRLLHEQLGIGWCFWPYKNLDSDSAVISIPKPKGWDLIATAGSADMTELSPGVLPSREQALAILNAYLDAAKFSNGRINESYLGSLGLTAPSLPRSADLSRAARE